MRSTVTALLAIVISVMLIVGLYIAVDSSWSSGEEEINITGSYFSNCISGVLEEENECELFKDTESTEGGVT